jgi:uncharacterized integral membrane protein
MTSPYKRRRPSIVRNFWIYRRLVGLAVMLGLLLWFIWANNDPVSVNFPFRLGKFQSSSGLVILLSALFGSGATALLMTLALAWRRMNPAGGRAPEIGEGSLTDDRPPPDYAAKASEAPAGENWP